MCLLGAEGWPAVGVYLKGLTQQPVKKLLTFMAHSFLVFRNSHFDKGRKSNKLNFLVAENGPNPENPPEKVYVGPFFASFPRK